MDRSGHRLAGVHIDGAHLRPPGHGEKGPTLEIFQYTQTVSAQRPELNRPGLAHLAFSVKDVEAAICKVKLHGGSAVGEIVTKKIEGAGTITFVYARDPEGNIIELQQWSA